MSTMAEPQAFIAQRKENYRQLLNFEIDANGEHTQAWKALLDDLRGEDWRALSTQAIYENEEGKALEERLGLMRAEHSRMSGAIPKLPKQNMPSCPPSNELKQEVSRVQHDLEQYQLRISAEVKVRWQRGLRKALVDWGIPNAIISDRDPKFLSDL